MFSSFPLNHLRNLTTKKKFVPRIDCPNVLRALSFAYSRSVSNFFLECQSLKGKKKKARFNMLLAVVIPPGMREANRCSFPAGRRDGELPLQEDGSPRQGLEELPLFPSAKTGNRTSLTDAGHLKWHLCTFQEVVLSPAPRVGAWHIVGTQ